MIDEELYQQANDELASERRDLRVWARACALAPEDHDEARYLYTNLRVEELLAERRGVSPSAGEVGGGGRGRSGAAALEPNAAGGTRDEDEEPEVPAGERRASEETSDEDECSRGTGSAPAAATASTGTTVACGRAGEDGGRPLAEEDDDILALFAAQEKEFGGLHGVAGAADREERVADGVRPASRSADIDRDREKTSDSPPPRQDDDVDDFDWLAQETSLPPAAAARPAATARPAAARGTSDRSASESGSDGEDDALVLELERQARELPIEQALPSTPPASVPLFEEVARPEPVPDPAPTRPFELDVGGRREYEVYQRPGSREQAVRQGGSVAALLLTLPWLLYRGLFGTAVAYILFSVAVLAGLTITGLAWLDAGAAATTTTRVAGTVFAALALFGMIVAPWWQANRWRQAKLERSGFALVARVRAPSRKAAFAAIGHPSRAGARHAAR